MLSLSAFQVNRALDPYYEYKSPNQRNALRKIFGAELGSGAFGHVYDSSTKPNEVVKVFDPTEDGYFEYVSFIFKHKLWERNPAFPKIIKILHAGEHLAIVTMEKLRECPNNRIVKEQAVKMGNMFRWRLKLLGKSRAAKLAREAFSSRYYPTYQEFCDSPLLALAYALRMIWRKWNGKFVMDIGERNILYRGNVPVVTDPLSSRNNDYIQPPFDPLGYLIFREKQITDTQKKKCRDSKKKAVPQSLGEILTQDFGLGPQPEVNYAIH